MLVGNTRDEGKLFPTMLPLVGGVAGRLLNDATVFSTAFNYNPEAAPATTVEQWIPAVVPAGDDARDRLQCEDRTAHARVLPGQPRQRAECAENAAEQHLVLPLRLGRAAAAVRCHLRRGARVRIAVRVRQLRAVAVREHLVHHGPTSRAGWRCRTR